MCPSDRTLVTGTDMAGKSSTQTRAKPSRSAKKPRAPSKARATDATTPREAPRVLSPRSIHIGDSLQIERRYVVDGVLTCMTDKGRFNGVQQIGTAEHLVLEDGENGVRMIPLPTIAEILLLESASRAAPARPESDPSFA